MTILATLAKVEGVVSIHNGIATLPSGETLTLGAQEQASPATPFTKRIRVELSARARFTYTEVIEVPSCATDYEITNLIHRRYDEIDATDFTQDPEYWERGNQTYEDCDDSDPQPILRATREDGQLWTERIEPPQD